MKALDADLAKYDAKLDLDITVDVNRQTRTNVALRLPGGQDILLSLIDCGDYMNVDVSNFADGGEVPMKAWGLTEGRGTEAVEGAVMIVMAPKAGA